MVAATAPPLFRAVASSTRQLSQLLKCINFSNGKVHVEITEDGIKFAADHSRVMQGKERPGSRNLDGGSPDVLNKQPLMRET